MPLIECWNSGQRPAAAVMNALELLVWMLSPTTYSASLVRVAPVVVELTPVSPR